MTKNNTVEKIDNIIKIINNNINDGEVISKKNLEQSEVESLLYKVDDELTKLRKSAEGENKEVVEKKVRDLKGSVNEAIDNDWGWARVKKFLGESLRSELNELKDKLTELEIQNREKEEALEKELAEVKEKLNKAEAQLKTLDMYQEKIKEKEKEIQELKQQLGEKDKELEKEKISKKPAFSDVIQVSEEQAMEIIKAGTKAGNDSLPLFGGLYGATFGGVVGSASVFTTGIGELFNRAREELKDFSQDTIHVGSHLLEKYMEGGKDSYKVTLESGTELAINAGNGTVSVIKEGMKYGDEARKELKDFTENMANLGLEGVENWRKGWENLTMEVVGNTEKFREGMENVTVKVMDNATDVANNFLDIFKGTGTIEEKLKAAEQLAEIFKERVEEIKVEHKQQKEEIKAWYSAELEKKDEEIRRLRNDLTNQQLRQEKTQESMVDKTFAMMEAIVKSKDSGVSIPPPYTPSKQ